MPTLGKYVEAMDDENNLLYPKTVAAQVIYSAGQMLPGKIAELEGNIRNVDQKVDNVKNEVDNAKNDNNQIYPTLKGRLDAMDTRTKTNTDEIANARDRKGVIHPNLKARLDAMDTDFETTKNEIEQARGGENSLGDRLTTIVNGNQTTLDEVIKARDGETDLDARLDKMQTTITTTSNQVTQAMTDDLGVTHPTLQVRLDTMRQDAERTDTEVVNARTSQNFPNAPYANLKARLDAMDVGTNEVKKEISDARGVGNATLKDRLDDMQNQINAGGGGGGGATIQEVVDARTDNITTPNVIHNSLGDRLDSMQTNINNKVDKSKVNQEARPLTIVERTDTADIKVGSGVAFHDIATNTYIGGIGIGDGDSNGIPFKSEPVHITPANIKHQIWTSETAPIDENATNNTIAKRNNDGQLYAKAYRLFDTNGIYKGALDCSATPMVGDPIWWNNVTARNSTIWNEENLPIESGDFNPWIGGYNGGGFDVVGQGRYNRIGDMVTIQINVRSTNKNNPTGQLVLGGLPFAAKEGLCSASISYFTGFILGQGKQLSAYCAPTTSNILFAKNSPNDGSTFEPLNSTTETGNNIEFALSMSYRVN